LERLLAEEAPNGEGKAWERMIAEALVRQAAKGDVRAITELADRIEGKPLQAMAVAEGGLDGLAEAIQKARKRAAHEKG
jgi:predicted deacetylase